MQELKLRVLSLLNGGWQFRWWGLAAAWLVCILGWVAVALVPNTYQSTAEVYVDTDTLMRPLLKGIAVSTDTQQEIDVMLHTLLTTPNLDRVVRLTDPHASSMSADRMQDAVASLAQNVTLSPTGTRNLYGISYSAEGPRQAQSVAQALVSVMEDSNAGDHRRDSDDALSFIDTQIADYQRKIEAADKRKTDFQLAHPGVFLEGNDVNADNAAVFQAENKVSDVDARVASLQAQIASTPKTIDVNGPAPIAIGGAGTLADKRQQLGQARAALAELRAHYTDSYPDVVAQRHLIARLESELNRKTPATEDPDLEAVTNPAYLMLRTKLADQESDLAAARERLAEAQKRVADDSKDEAQSVKVRRQYADIDRDSAALHKNYEALVERREAAHISEAASADQSALVFRVVQPPTLPNRPVEPDRILLNILVLAVGLGAGAGTAIAVSLLSGRLLTVEDLRQAFAVPVLGSVTIARNAQDVLLARRATSYFATGAGLLVVGYLIVLLFFHTTVISTGGSVL